MCPDLPWRMQTHSLQKDFTHYEFTPKPKNDMKNKWNFLSPIEMAYRVGVIHGVYITIVLGIVVVLILTYI